MKRRTCLKEILAGAGSLTATVAVAEIPGHPIQLHVDLSVDPTRERRCSTTSRPSSALPPAPAGSSAVRQTFRQVTRPIGAGRVAHLPGLPA